MLEAEVKEVEVSPDMEETVSETLEISDSDSDVEGAGVDTSDTLIPVEEVLDTGDGNVSGEEVKLEVVEDATDAGDDSNGTVVPDIPQPTCLSNQGCEDGNPCTDNLCDPTKGCLSLPNTATCTDNNVCTSDLCEQASCTSKLVVCDDGNVCTNDLCVGTIGCVAVPNSATCTDLNECTVGELCVKSVCGGTKKKECADDDNPCTDHPCDVAVGCTATVNVSPCSDDNKCTEGDVCSSKSCSPGKPVLCNDGNVCTQDSCQPNKGCQMTPVAEGAQCGMDMVCKVGTCLELVPPPGMVLIPAGSFWMGCTASEKDLCANNPEEKPQHKVTLGTYSIDKNEVTVAAYEKCVTAGVCAVLTGCNTQENKVDHPVNCVTWSQADTYCKWVGKRLPTEAEWEKSAKGCGQEECGQGTPIFPWGNEDPKSCPWANYAFCGYKSTVSVQSLSESSGLTVVGLGSNVSEWVADWYGPNYYAASLDSTNPLGPPTGTKRVLRGGNFTSQLLSCRAAIRQSADPATAIPQFGFRCAKNAPVVK
jgi:formylglycine-generating enzyme required for sulfatase activity